MTFDSLTSLLYFLHPSLHSKEFPLVPRTTVHPRVDSATPYTLNPAPMPDCTCSDPPGKKQITLHYITLTRETNPLCRGFNHVPLSSQGNTLLRQKITVSPKQTLPLTSWPIRWSLGGVTAPPTARVQCSVSRVCTPPCSGILTLSARHIHPLLPLVKWAGPCTPPLHSFPRTSTHNTPVEGVCSHIAPWLITPNTRSRSRVAVGAAQWGGSWETSTLRCVTFVLFVTL